LGNEHAREPSVESSCRWPTNDCGNRAGCGLRVLCKSDRPFGRAVGKGPLAGCGRRVLCKSDRPFGRAVGKGPLAGCGRRVLCKSDRPFGRAVGKGPRNRESLRSSCSTSMSTSYTAVSMTLLFCGLLPSVSLRSGWLDSDSLYSAATSWVSSGVWTPESAHESRSAVLESCELFSW